MAYQKILRLLPGVCTVVLVLLAIELHSFVPLLGVGLVVLLLLAIKEDWLDKLRKWRASRIVYYQPTQQPATPYQPGYQARAPRPARVAGMPKDASPSDYEQPAAQYPEQLPPILQ